MLGLKAEGYIYIYPKIPNNGRTSNKMCAPLFWRKKNNWKIMGAHQIKMSNVFDKSWEPAVSVTVSLFVFVSVTMFVFVSVSIDPSEDKTRHFICPINCKWTVCSKVILSQWELQHRGVNGIQILSFLNRMFPCGAVVGIHPYCSCEALLWGPCGRFGWFPLGLRWGVFQVWCEVGLDALVVGCCVTWREVECRVLGY